MGLHVIDDDMSRFVYQTLEHMNMNMPIMSDYCPHCRLPVRRPLVVNKSDAEMISKFMSAISEVADRHGITLNLLAEVRTQCLVATAQRDSK